MTQDELVEKVARAMCAAANADPDATNILSDSPFGGRPLWHIYRGIAKTALTALGLLGDPPTHWLAPWEATEGMRDEADDCGFPVPEGSFTAMRDAYLKEEAGS